MNVSYPDGTHVFGIDGTPGVAYVDDSSYARCSKQSVTPPGFPQGGCSSGGFQSGPVSLPFLGLFALRRRRLAA